MWTKVANISAAKQVSGITRIEEENESDCFVFKIFGKVSVLSLIFEKMVLRKSD